MIFPDRTEAGRELAKLLKAYKGHKDVLILGIPRGGVPVARQVAEELQAPLDVFVVRKLGVPGEKNSHSGQLRLTGFVLWTTKSLERSKYLTWKLN